MGNPGDRFSREEAHIMTNTSDNLGFYAKKKDDLL